MRIDIVKARKRARLTQKQVAAVIGRAQSDVSRYESGARQIPVDVAPHLAELLGLPLMRLLYPTRQPRKVA